MESRSIFALHGIAGLLVATVLLLAVEGTLVFLAVGAQQGAAQDYYYIEDAKGVQMSDAGNASHVVLHKDKPYKKDK